MRDLIPLSRMRRQKNQMALLSVPSLSQGERQVSHQPNQVSHKLNSPAHKNERSALGREREIPDSKRELTNFRKNNVKNEKDQGPHLPL